MDQTIADTPDAKGPGRRTVARFRPWVQGVFTLAWLSPFLLHTVLKAADSLPPWLQWVRARLHQVPACMFHCYACPLASAACPIGVMASFSAAHVVPFLTLGVIVTVAALVGAMVCGWACPFGFLQDLIAKIPTPKFRIPDWMGVGRYLVLIGLVVVVPLIWGKHDNALFICRLCPAGAVEAAVPAKVAQSIEAGHIVWLSWPKMTILIVFVGAALFTRRAWCTVLCPLGGLMAIFNRLSLLHLKFVPSKCIECNRCRSFCPYGVKLDLHINDTRCNRCLDCTACHGIDIRLADMKRKPSV
ncbi:MAG: 4Fe-4S binding protein [Planctomycetota bacterium]